MFFQGDTIHHIGCDRVHSAGQCEFERVCSFHNPACQEGSNWSTCSWRLGAEPHLGQNILRHVREHRGRVRLSFICVFMALFANVVFFRVCVNRYTY